MALPKLRTGALIAVLSTLVLAGCGSQQSAGLHTGRVGAPQEMKTEFTPETLVGVANQLYDSGEFEQALSFYQRARFAAPEDVRAYRGIGLSLAALGMPERALPSLEHAVSLAPEDATVRLALAKVALSAGQAQLASENYQFLAASGTSDVDVYNGLAVASDLLGNHLNAQANYSMAITMAPENRNIRNNLALSFAFSGEFEAAREVLSDLQETPRGRQNLALVYGLEGDQAKARELAHLDLPPEAVNRNLASYESLRTLPSNRQAAIVLIGRDLPEQSVALAP